MSEIAELYCDGGVIKANPSKLGGTWAWCLVDARDQRLDQAAGTVTPLLAGLAKITNNYTELYAVVMGLTELPDGWAGTVFTDSAITRNRVRKGHRAGFQGIPQALRDTLDRQKARLGAYKVVLVAGHPSRLDLARGRKPDGHPVSRHNVLVDARCRAQARIFLAQLAQGAAP